MSGKDFSGKGFSSSILITPDHGALTGLETDDHIQYHNDERGDERYLSKNNASSFTPSADYNPATKKYVDNLVSAAGGGDMLTTVYDSNVDGKVNIADVADNVPWSGITDKPSAFPPDIHNHDEMYYTESELQTAGQSQVHWDNITNIPAQGISNHSALIGLSNDDHPQYHNDLRGDSRYYQKSQVDGVLADKADISHNHNSLYSPLSHNHTDYAQLAHGHDAEYLNRSNMAAYSPTSDYHPATKKYVDDTTAVLGVGDMLKTVYDTNADGKVNSADSADSVPWTGITDMPSSFPPETHQHDERYYTESELQTAGQSQVHWDNISNVPALGVTEHGALSGLIDDDHTQYLNDARGDARYYQKSQVDSALAYKADTAHDHDTIYSPLSHNHNTAYSPLAHNHNSDYAQLVHGHDAEYLSKTNLTEYTPAATYHPATKGYVDDNIAGLGNGDMLTSVYDTDADGKVNSADAADCVPWTGITDKPGVFPPETHQHDERYYTESELQTAGQAQVHWDNISNVPDLGVTEHGALSGLNNDDHTQYLNDVRGDARYYQKSEVDSKDANMAGSGRTTETIKATYDDLQAHKSSTDHDTHIATLYYNKSQLQTEGQSLIHWGNLTNVPNLADSSWKTAVANYSDLPTTANSINDMRVVANDGDNKSAIYRCNATTGTIAVQWEKLADLDWTNDHSALTGLGNDDHTQYLNDVRGDARYYPKSQIDSALANKADTTHNHDTDYLSKTNIEIYTPTSSYHPATKKYVDDNLSSFTASRVLISDSNGTAAASSVSSTELSYLEGVTSGVQSQLNSVDTRLTGVESSYLKKDGSVTMTGDLVIDNSNKGIIFNGGGEKIIGTADYGIEFQTSSGNPRLKILNSGEIAIKSTTLSLYNKYKIQYNPTENSLDFVFAG